ncbi:MAG: hypothetical protein F6K28_44070 [Microcoleus sp. SIO2G3]|nr:hypothetical protein [Microcoleus sp. SIO2G3]
MTLEEFEGQYREAIDDALNQMQTVVLLLAQAETKTVELGNSLQNIRSMMDNFFAQQPRCSQSDAISEEFCQLRAAELELRQILSGRS